MTTNKDIYKFSDFTEEVYCSYLKLAKENYSFITFDEITNDSGLCLWRHDIDFSPYRSLNIAKIENKEDVIASYFVLLHGEFYNPLEKEIANLILKIKDLGHNVGLHFDISYYGNSISKLQDLEYYLDVEKSFLEKSLGIKLTSFSFHNPGYNKSLSFKQDELCGMVNVYSSSIENNFSYTSDSFCIWKHKRLFNVLKQADERNIHILTHPVCWTEKETSPNERILTSIEERKERTIQLYLDRSKKIDRKIINW